MMIQKWMIILAEAQLFRLSIESSDIQHVQQQESKERSPKEKYVLFSRLFRCTFYLRNTVSKPASRIWWKPKPRSEEAIR